jgi:NAD-dependent dihydropyrimidine dehydrogenase PreA subunit
LIKILEKKNEKVDELDGIAVWGQNDPPVKLGIVGTTVVVDWDICEAHGVCDEVCPVQLYDWYDTLNHPKSERKAFPAREDECIQCLACQNGCPVEAIVISME